MKVHADHNYYVYILTNKSKTVLYVGITNELRNRLHYHRNPEAFSKAFTTRYRCYSLIYYEHYYHAIDAIKREKQLKGLRRDKKEAIINLKNPDWKFLNDQLE